MRIELMQPAESLHRGASLCSGGRMLRRFVVVLPAVCGLSILASGALSDPQAASAQTNPTPAAAPAHKQVHSHKKPAAANPAPQPTPPPAPVMPPPPNWPANDLPGAASVVFDSRGLLVVASNSSLTQILKEVALETGVKVDGMNIDQRVFGTYGPGPARDVLTQLLDGSGYDVLMIGDRGQGTPRRIVLTDQSGSAAKTTATNNPPPANDDTDSDQPPQEPQAEQEPPQPVQNGSGPPVPMRTPQQIMQEIQERERQRQNQNNQQNPQN